MRCYGNVTAVPPLHDFDLSLRPGDCPPDARFPHEREPPPARWQVRPAAAARSCRLCAARRYRTRGRPPIHTRTNCAGCRRPARPADHHHDGGLNGQENCRLSEAQSEPINLNAELSDTGRRRDQLLLAADERALDAVEVEVANLQKAHERQVARIRLLEQQAKDEEADAVLQRRKAHVARFTKKLNDADQVADELQATIELADKLFRKLITLREDARVAW